MNLDLRPMTGLKQRGLLVLALLVLGAACGNSATTSAGEPSISSAPVVSESVPVSTTPEQSPVDVADSPSTTQAQIAPETSEPSDAATPEKLDERIVTEYDLQRFLAAAEFSIVGSSYEGAIYGSPEIYIATAQAFCSRLSQGDPLTALIADYVAAANLKKASDEDLQFIGAILGAGVETLCPENSSKL